MNIKEFFRGTPQEIAAKRTVNQLDARLSRRLFLRQLALTAGGLALLASGGVSFLALEKLADDQEEQADAFELGEKIRSWRLPDGTKMIDVIPELSISADVYQKKSLEEYLPTNTDPIKVVYSNEELSNKGSGVLHFSYRFSQDETIKIINEAPGVETYDSPIISNTSSTIILPLGMKGMTAEKVVAAKESIQVAEYTKYARYYTNALENNGAKFTVVNPNNEEISEDLINLSIAVVQNENQKKQFGKAIFEELVDEGAHIRLGGIAYANWKVNYPNEWSRAQDRFKVYGDRVAGIMQQEGVIFQSGNTFRYTEGKSPEIGSEKFQKLFTRFTGLPGK